MAKRVFPWIWFKMRLEQISQIVHGACLQCIASDAFGTDIPYCSRSLFTMYCLRCVWNRYPILFTEPVYNVLPQMRLEQISHIVHGACLQCIASDVKCWLTLLRKRSSRVYYLSFILALLIVAPLGVISDVEGVMESHVTSISPHPTTLHPESVGLVTLHIQLGDDDAIDIPHNTPRGVAWGKQVLALRNDSLKLWGTLI